MFAIFKFAWFHHLQIKVSVKMPSRRQPQLMQHENSICSLINPEFTNIKGVCLQHPRPRRSPGTKRAAMLTGQSAARGRPVNQRHRLTPPRSCLLSLKTLLLIVLYRKSALDINKNKNFTYYIIIQFEILPFAVDLIT